MNDHIDKSCTTSITFRFGSRQVQTVDKYLIEKIPYLTALVSAGTSFDSIKEDQKYYLLDSHINYEDFLFVLDSISFRSVRHIFTRLPKDYDILAIIDLMDFLVICPENDPTLDEVSSSFFWNADFGHILGTYQFIYRPLDIQNMAARFGIAIVKEKYDLRNRHVIDQIYWFIMFILSAYELFDTNFRYHMRRIASNCFSLVCPSLLKCLNRLDKRIEQEISTRKTDPFNFHDENSLLWNLNTFDHNCPFHFWDLDYLSIQDRCGLKFRRCSCTGLMLLAKNKKDSSFLCKCRKSLYQMDENIEDLRKNVLEKMYKSLLGKLLDQLLIENNDYKFDELNYKSVLEEALNSKSVQGTIEESIISEIRELKSQLEQKYVELMKQIRAYGSNLATTIESEVHIHSMHLYREVGKSILNGKQNEALISKLTLEKLYRYELIMDEIRNSIIIDLYDLFIDEIKIFHSRRQELRTLLNSLSMQ